MNLKLSMGTRQISFYCRHKHGICVQPEHIVVTRDLHSFTQILKIPETKFAPIYFLLFVNKQNWELRRFIALNDFICKQKG